MSTKLKVTDFSCIAHAEIELGSLTVLIGPSGSGKSILSKLVFFFNNLLADQFLTIEDKKDLDSFKEQVKERFKDWFPVEAWGSEKFCIEFEAGSFQVRLTRIEYRKKLGENMRVWFSPYFEEQYTAAVVSLRGVDVDLDIVDAHSMDPFWRVRMSVSESNQRNLGSDFHQLQTFIPAGRSFFTSIGKSIAAFEHGRVLDPLIVRFGRYYAALRENRAGSRRASLQKTGEWADKLHALLEGRIVTERSKEYLHAADGRKIPISALSSGQQELMPLVLALENRASEMTMKRYRQLIFIEEPEAHLFPTSQSALVGLLAALLTLSHGRTKLFVTTHSPYVLAKLNNLIKAKQIAGRRGTKKYQNISSIIDERSWIDGSEVRAYGIHNGEVYRIQDSSDHMIDAEYLDGVSGEISSEFSMLLDAEYGS